MNKSKIKIAAARSPFRNLLLLAFSCLAPLLLSAEREKGQLALHSLPHARYHFDGLIGQRIQANVENWLLTAPAANPGMIQMFHLRDRKPVPALVPWAGEFVGKYLISAIQALRMTSRSELREVVSEAVLELIASQAENGYLGPFPRVTQLKANWDLWGHYHCLLALLMWHETTGDAMALNAARKAADYICSMFLESNLRVLDAGSPEMNMAIIHALGWLHRVTAEPRYLRMMREIEKDWEQAGDYLRTGLAGVDFFQTPKPRWESLHDLQGLTELFLITGDTRYRTAFTHHWRSIQKWDRRNTGGFSSGEQATGNPFAPTAIETCCTVAWMALSIDMLRLTGDSRVADELELSTFNAAAGAQHPSGRWWTYSTPMNGVREASTQAIVFQARAGTPELNCCAVNGPRSLGMLSDWAIMKTTNGLAMNYFGPGSFQGKLPDHTPIALEVESDYPLAKRVNIRVEPLAARRFSLQLRIPEWSHSTVVRLNNAAVANVVPGRYLEIHRRWRPGDRIMMDFDLALRSMPGEREASGRVAVYRGPLLLAFDQRHNEFDEDAIPALELQKFGEAKDAFRRSRNDSRTAQPWILVDMPAKDGRLVRLSDFANAGASGTRYVSWLPFITPGSVQR